MERLQWSGSNGAALMERLEWNGTFRHLPAMDRQFCIAPRCIAPDTPDESRRDAAGLALFHDSIHLHSRRIQSPRSRGAAGGWWPARHARVERAGTAPTRAQARRSLRPPLRESSPCPPAYSESVRICAGGLQGGGYPFTMA